MVSHPKRLALPRRERTDDEVGRARSLRRTTGATKRAELRLLTIYPRARQAVAGPDYHTHPR